MRRELFLYWRTPAAGLAGAEAALREWQAELRSRLAGLRTGRFRRVDAGPTDGTDAAPASATLMETYACEVGDLPAEWIERLVDEGNRRLQPWLHGSRHAELFERRTDATGDDD